MDLDKVKDRILEYLAVQKRMNKIKRSYIMFSRSTWSRQNIFR